MNWNHFILLLTGIYLGYFAINIIADLYLIRKTPGKEADQDVLFFSEDSQPEIILYDDEPEQPHNAGPAPQMELSATEPQQVYPAPVMESTGALSLKELTRVAQQRLLQYTKTIPY
jgi:hypothetical protein